MEQKKRKQLLQGQRIAIGFLIIILTGTLLLMLPFATREGQTTSLSEAMFTAVSATCVTGLVVVDTWSHWTLFGQLVILSMIQIGGLGFVTLGIGFSILLRRNIGLRERGMMQESVNALQLGGVVRLAKHILLGTLLIEGAGAVLLTIRFLLLDGFGFFRSLYYGIFHAVSAFCNAGFDLMGFEGPYSSFVNYTGDIWFNAVITALIIIGGIGFMVWEDAMEHGLRFRRYSLHTKMVLTMTGFLLVSGTVLFWLLERDALFAGMSLRESLLGAWFSSVTARTAGFNTVDTTGLSAGSRLLTIMLMFIGGSPGSTAGGIKTTTIFVMLLYTWATVRGREDCSIYGRRLPSEAIRKATVVLTLNLLLALTAMLVIFAGQELAFGDICFEAFSAIGTVGMSTGVTRQLSGLSRVAIMILMYGGRVGSMSFALSFLSSKKQAPVRLPQAPVSIG